MPSLSPARLDLPELNWLNAESDRVAALTQRPPSCLAKPATRDLQDQHKLGEIIFNSPALLGGQAEKKGLSCGSCHNNGRSNPNFQFEAVSGAPGTADVTSGLFSKVRADNTFNPVPIPDLALPDGQDQVDRTDRAALAVFVRGQIEDEFGGDPPPEPVFEALLTYLQSIDAPASDCEQHPFYTADWTGDWDAAKLAADQAATSQTRQTRAFYIRTARLSLGRIHDRYNAHEHANIRAELIEMSRRLSANRGWPENTDALRARLQSAAKTSFYDAQALSGALEAAGR